MASFVLRNRKALVIKLFCIKNICFRDLVNLMGDLEVIDM